MLENSLWIFFFHIFFLGFQRKQLTLKKKKLLYFSLSHLSLALIQAGHRCSSGLNRAFHIPQLYQQSPQEKFPKALSLFSEQEI